MLKQKKYQNLRNHNLEQLFIETVQSRISFLKNKSKSLSVSPSPHSPVELSQILKKTHIHPCTSLPEKSGLIPGRQHKLHPPLTEAAHAMEPGPNIQHEAWGECAEADSA